MSSNQTAKVPRNTEIGRLSRFLASKTPGLSICSISGPGGVGKTYLYEHVLKDIDLANEGFLTLKVDASNPQARARLLDLLTKQLAPSSALPRPARSDRDYFTNLRQVETAYSDLIAGVEQELAKSTAPEEQKQLLLALLRAGRFLNKAVPVTKQYLDIASLEKDNDTREAIAAVWKLGEELISLRQKTWVPSKLRNVLGLSIKQAVKTDLYNVAATALVEDLAQALAPASPAYDLRRFFKNQIPGAYKLLLIVDDFEALAPVLGDFLVGALIPKLGAADFPTRMLIIGRDDVQSTHVGWDQYCEPYHAEQLRLRAFDREDAFALLAKTSIPEEQWPSIVQRTHGFPYLLTLIAEDSQQADSAAFLRRFFDRTTKWMTETEKDWFVKVCYLEVVNTDTLSAFFSAAEAEDVQKWFEVEASIRDPDRGTFQVIELIREKVLKLLEIRSPSKHAAMREAATRTARTQP